MQTAKESKYPAHITLKDKQFSPLTRSSLGSQQKWLVPWLFAVPKGMAITKSISRELAGSILSGRHWVLSVFPLYFRALITLLSYSGTNGLSHTCISAAEAREYSPRSWALAVFGIRHTDMEKWSALAKVPRDLEAESVFTASLFF